ncbi:MAG: hypothetical protein SGI92_21155 [Bryobacteraceae bacterium]|nr:hypothetical protein [Bryobacteraceae bacterium]
MLTPRVRLTTEWADYAVSFEANETVSDSRIQFFLGARTGQVWLADISLTEIPPNVWTRDFTHGKVLLNGTNAEVTIDLPPGLRRFAGDQAPRWQYQIDDDSPAFTTTGSGWKNASFDTGQWKSRGPFYHHWGAGCRTLEGRDGEARWDLGNREDGQYQIQAWWASPAEQTQWTREAVYEVVAEGRVIATTILDQTKPGDRWCTIADIELTGASKPFVRLRNNGTGRLVADALTISSTARLNDGSPVSQVTMGPFDGLLLQRITPLPEP